MNQLDHNGVDNNAADPYRILMPKAKARMGRPPLPPDERAGAQIHLRVTDKRKAAYTKAAQKKGQTVAAWCFDALDRASGFKPL